ncbi:MAG TPA: glycosyltransferase family 2 protein [Rhodopila sp.]|uniref:glycosyltransferase family 2 protein n=1 Tax=Rhodopila sp. TaxID=2480087 RepID=UPI002B81D44F|nr:glycosyltransferase family 2 protein [Rhodopila sp.]HVY15780.1 glycosyltransferase family 2 protein [Rhodopila sp.]
MTRTTILMPMAGAGQRFRDAGETRPKPLVPVLGVPMARLAAQSLRRGVPDAAVVCVIQAAHDAAYGLGARLRAALPGARIATVPAPTGGALETCLAADPLVTDRTGPLVVMDCDLTFAAPAYCDRLGAMRDTAGLLLSFRSRLPRYSYALVEAGRVVRTAEKDPISDHALIGAYGFASADLFFGVARAIVGEGRRVGGEFYVSAAFNVLIARGLTVRLEDADAYWSFGTPEEHAAAVADPALAAHVRTLLEGGP